MVIKHGSRFVLVLAALMLLTAASAAHAVLERVGPINNAPSVGSYPAWYQDATGLSVEFCDLKNQAELDGGWCLLLPGDTTVPEVFPSNFADEHFYYSVSADFVVPASLKKILWEAAVEAAFAADVTPGGQIVFTRIRMRLEDVPVTGTYRFLHPYGEEILEGVAGDRIFFTDDVGIACEAGTFDCAMQGRLGPFLLASDTPGGPELPPVTGPVLGKLYVATPDRSGPVTGSQIRNLVRIEGPPGSNLDGQGNDFIETTNFSLMGRIFTGVMPGQVTVDRASYARDAGAAVQKLDVFATASETLQGRLPTEPRPAPITPILSFFDAPCGGVVSEATGDILPPFTQPAGGTETQMLGAGTTFWGQALPAILPAAVCVKDSASRDANGQVVPTFYLQSVTDQVTITGAAFDPLAPSLTVTASSSDENTPPTLRLGAFGNVPPTDFVNGTALISPLAVPPSKVRVFSSAGGSNEYLVTTGLGTPTSSAPVAVNDSFTIVEDSGATTLDILTNDTFTGIPTITIVAAPQLGAAVVNADGTIGYTPSANASGADSFAYTLTIGGVASNPANAAIDITPLNDPPVAVNDSVGAGVGTTTINVLANDTDVDGAADLAGVLILTPPQSPAIATLTNGGTAVSFTTTAAGTYTFTYQALDQAGATSNNTATVTVAVTAAGAETITVTRTELRGGRFRAVGTVSPANNQTMTVRFATNNQVIAGSPAFTTLVAADGTWRIDVSNVSAPANATQVRVRSSNGTVVFAPLVRR